MSTPLVDIRDISHRFGQLAVLKNVSLRIEPGSYTILLGPSGSGKTTLLSILGGFVNPSEGKVLIRGEDCTSTPPARRPTTTVFQDYALFPHMSVGANVGFGLRMQGVDAATRAAKAREALALVGLASAFDKKPHQLSGGQRQRVALARALVIEPAVLLLDEPLGALDALTRIEMHALIERLWREHRFTALLVTHDVQEAVALGDRILLIEQGRVALDQSVPLDRPRARASAAFAALEDRVLKRVLAGGPGAADHDAEHQADKVRPVGQIRWAV